ncbi:MAG: hypothetical protein AAFN92_16485, partial [Bacteroidota bacterium]
KSEQITYSCRKGKFHPGRAKLPDHLPVEGILLEPEADAEWLECIGEEVTDTLDYRPGKLIIIRRRRLKYARPEAAGSSPSCPAVPSTGAFPNRVCWPNSA